ncbi:MAG: hypothetical protein HY548_07360 [Elusimicrobia bacterium]|nr:hypothetical protein [Elusimicrobiota bacterium]
MFHAESTSAPLMFLSPRKEDKRTIQDMLENFDGFHVGATTPAHMVNFVREVGRPFYVDPMAYLFTLPADQLISRQGGTRVSVTRLAERYGSLLAETVGKRTITSDDLLGQMRVLDDMTCNALDYQRQKMLAGDLNRNLINRFHEKYHAIEAHNGRIHYVANAVTPIILIPPYFYFRDLTDPWFVATRRCAQMAQRYKQAGEKICPVLFMDKALLRAPRVTDQIIESLENDGSDGILIWVNDFLEEKESLDHLANLRRLVAGLGREDRPVFKLYGGFYSCLLHEHGLRGFTCDLSGKTSRNIFAFGSSIPKPAQPKFYIPRLHRAFKLDEAEFVLKEFPFLRCRCRLCHEAYANNMEIFAPRMRRPGFCETHFLNVRRAELHEVGQHGIEPLIDRMAQTVQEIEANNPLDLDVGHLVKWRQSIMEHDGITKGSESWNTARFQTAS